jgi:hypothetical protein
VVPGLVETDTCTTSQDHLPLKISVLFSSTQAVCRRSRLAARRTHEGRSVVTAKFE